RTTGLVLLQDQLGEHSNHREGGAVIWAAEIAHRGQQVHAVLDQRRSSRRACRQRYTRYREPRFQNRRRPEGWLSPSLESRVQKILTRVERLCQLCSMRAINLETARFDTQLLHNPDTSGLEYQQGTLVGTEIREYLFLKWQHRCAYCRQQGTRWEVDHIIPRSRSGSDRPSHVVLACQPCNAAKGDRTAEVFAHPAVQAQVKATLQDAAAVNSTRRSLHRRLLTLGLPVEAASG